MKLESKKNEIKSGYNLSHYVPKQIIEPIPTNENSNYENFKLSTIKTNVFKTNNNYIDLTIPVSSEYLKIVDIMNIPNIKINAIIVLLDGNEGETTLENAPTHLIKSKPKIDKIIGLSTQNLIRDKKLVIYVLHDNNFTEQMKLDFIACANSLGATYPDVIPNCKAIVLPKEIKGDIISGK